MIETGEEKKKTRAKKKWDQTKIVDESLLVEKSSFQPIFKLGSKILFGLILFGAVLLTTSIRKKFNAFYPPAGYYVVHIIWTIIISYGPYDMVHVICIVCIGIVSN